MAESKTEEHDRQWWNHSSYLVASMFNSAFAAAGAKNFKPFEADHFNPWANKETKSRKPWVDRTMRESPGLKVHQVSKSVFQKVEP